MSIFNWISHLHLKINMSKTKLLTFFPSQVLLEMPPFFKVPPFSQMLSLVPFSYLVTSGSPSSLSFSFLSIPFQSYLNPHSDLGCYPRLLLGPWIPVSLSLPHPPHCSRAPLRSCFCLVENPSVNSSFMACHSHPCTI